MKVVLWHPLRIRNYLRNTQTKRIELKRKINKTKNFSRCRNLIELFLQDSCIWFNNQLQKWISEINFQTSKQKPRSVRSICLSGWANRKYTKGRKIDHHYWEFMWKFPDGAFCSHIQPITHQFARPSWPVSFSSTRNSWSGTSSQLHCRVIRLSHIWDGSAISNRTVASRKTQPSPIQSLTMPVGS